MSWDQQGTPYQGDTCPIDPNMLKDIMGRPYQGTGTAQLGILT